MTLSTAQYQRVYRALERAMFPDGTPAAVNVHVARAAREVFRALRCPVREPEVKSESVTKGHASAITEP